MKLGISLPLSSLFPEWIFEVKQIGEKVRATKKAFIKKIVFLLPKLFFLAENVKMGKKDEDENSKTPTLREQAGGLVGKNGTWGNLNF